MWVPNSQIPVADRAVKPKKDTYWSDLRNQVIVYRGYAATRAQAYDHAFAATGNHLSAERMAYGFDIPVLTTEQQKRYLPLSAMRKGA